MESLFIEATSATPEVKFDFNKGLLDIKGVSKTTNALEFYKPIMLAIDEYAVKMAETTTVNIFLTYFSTSSSLCILGILKELKNLNDSNTKVVVNWYYEEDDEDMLDAIEDYQTLIPIEFNFIPVS